jgi:heptaprenyl diphosphate synthase
MAARAEGDAWILKEVSPFFLFFFGLALAPSLWLQAHLAWKAAQALLFFALAAWARPRGWWRAGLASLIFLSVTVAVNLAVPLGRVLWRLGPWSITQGALEGGLAKGLTLVGLAYLSRFSVRPDLRLPGAVGRYVARTLFYLNRLLELRRTLSFSRLTDSLDGVLEKLWAQSPASRSRTAAAASASAARPAAAAPALAARAAARGRFPAAAVAVLGGLLAASYGILFL